MKMNIDNKLILENSKNLRALYVEDDNLVRDATLPIFTRYFKSVDVASDGEEGLGLYLHNADEEHEAYDIILSDINMPNMDGLTMCEQILKDNIDQKIILITAHNDSDFLHKAINIGVSGFLTKPLDSTQLKIQLYKITKAIADKKALQTYYNHIEDLNHQLEHQNHELKKSLRILDTVLKKDEQKQIKQTKIKPKRIDDMYQLQLQEFKQDALPDLKEVHEEIDYFIIQILEKEENEIYDTTMNLLPSIIKNFKEYASTISIYPFFYDLSIEMQTFTSSIETTPLPKEHEKIHAMFSLLETFMFVLRKWQEKLQSENDISKINHLDASIVNDLKTIVMIWKDEYDDSSDVVEFF